MNFKNIIAGIFRDIELLFKNFPRELKTAIEIGVTVTENIKILIDSPAADILTLLIPGNLDDNLKDVLRQKLPLVLVELRLAENSDNTENIIKAGLITLNGLSDTIKNVFYHNLSVLIAQIVAHDRLSWKDGVYLLEWYYQTKIKTVQP